MLFVCASLMGIGACLHCAAITVREMAIFRRLTRQKAQHGVSQLIKCVLCRFLLSSCKILKQTGQWPEYHVAVAHLEGQIL